MKINKNYKAMLKHSKMHYYITKTLTKNKMKTENIKIINSKYQQKL